MAWTVYQLLRTEERVEEGWVGEKSAEAEKMEGGRERGSRLEGWDPLPREVVCVWCNNRVPWERCAGPRGYRLCAEEEEGRSCWARAIRGNLSSRGQRRRGTLRWVLKGADKGSGVPWAALDDGVLEKIAGLW